MRAWLGACTITVGRECAQSCRILPQFAVGVAAWIRGQRRSGSWSRRRRGGESRRRCGAGQGGLAGKGWRGKRVGRLARGQSL